MMMWSGTQCLVISCRVEALFSIHISYISPVRTLLGYSIGAGGKNQWPEADEEPTCVAGACNIVLHETDPTVCVFTALLRRGGGTHTHTHTHTLTADLLVEQVSIELELHSRLFLSSCDHPCISWVSRDPSKWSHRPEWVLQGWKQMALLMPHWLTDWL